mmetsp:Transcript_4924/g.15743  ORF Transcript_4924/g.15743 Transcript_4924/m.15743 type:complete len:277 (-) Transcript_4924:377-1207(-)
MRRVVDADVVVDDRDDAVEDQAVNVRAQRVARRCRGARLERHLVGGELAAAHGAVRDGVHQLLRSHLQQRGASLDLLGVLGLGALLAGLEVEVAQLQHENEHLVQLEPCLLGEANLEQRLVHVLELSRVVPSRHLRDGALLVADLVVLPLCQPERLAHRRGRLGEHVEDVVVSLALEVDGDTRLLEQVGRREGANDDAIRRKLHVKVLAEAGRVVVAHRLGVAERLHDGVCLHQPRRDLVRDSLALLGRHLADVREGNLHRLGLAGARLARDENRL